MTLKSLGRFTLGATFALVFGVSSLAAQNRPSNINGNQNDSTGHQHDKMNPGHSGRQKRMKPAPRRVRRGRNPSPGIRRGRIISNTSTNSNTRMKRNSNTNGNGNMN
jgi:hypothetical protein